METYDPAQVSLVVGGNIISGFMDGTFIQVTRDEDTWTLLTGSDGEVARARNHNRAGKIVVTLMQTSPANDILSALHQRDYLTGIPAGATRIADGLGNTVLGGDEAYVLKPADVGFGKELEAREWTIVVPKLDGLIGGAA